MIEDLMQEILFAAWQALPTFWGDSSLRSWVMGIARHKLQDYYRKRIETVQMPETDGFHYEPESVLHFEEQLDLDSLNKSSMDTIRLFAETFVAAPKPIVYLIPQCKDY